MEEGKFDQFDTIPTNLVDIAQDNIDGESTRIGDVLGSKVTLIVNVASKCGLTDSNYSQLSEIYNKYKDQGLQILGFPSNQFLAQEPGTNAEIKAFSREQYGVSFPLFSKVDVNGENTCPAYRYLRGNSSLRSETEGYGRVAWNFGKFLVNSEGQIVQYYGPKVEPNTIVPDIEKLLQTLFMFDSKRRSIVAVP